MIYKSDDVGYQSRIYCFHFRQTQFCTNFARDSCACIQKQNPLKTAPLSLIDFESRGSFIFINFNLFIYSIKTELY